MNSRLRTAFFVSGHRFIFVNVTVGDALSFFQEGSNEQEPTQTKLLVRTHLDEVMKLAA